MLFVYVCTVDQCCSIVYVCTVEHLFLYEQPSAHTRGRLILPFLAVTNCLYLFIQGWALLKCLPSMLLCQLMLAFSGVV